MRTFTVVPVSGALLLALATSAVPSPTGIATWRRIDPPMLASASFAFDPTHRRCLLFGGETFLQNPAGTEVAQLQGKTYVADLTQGQTWTELVLDPSPGPRAAALTIYDAKHDRFIVAGGRDGTGTFADVWSFEFEPTPHWTLLSDAVDLPAPAYDGVPAIYFSDPAPTTPALYDSIGNRLVTFSNGRFLTMSLDGPLVMNRAGMINAPFLNGASLAGDFAHGKIYAVQSLSPNPDSLLGVVWEFDYLNHNTWRRHNGVGDHPGRRIECAVALDPDSSRLVVAGGHYTNWFSLLPDPRPNGSERMLYTFALDGSDTWSRISAPGPAPHGMRKGATAYDPVTKSLLIQGGYVVVNPTDYHPHTPGDVQEPELHGLSFAGVPTWSVWAPPGVANARNRACSAVDPVRRRWFVYGGTSVRDFTAEHDLFEIDLDHPGGWKRIGDGMGPSFHEGAMTFTGTSLLAVGGNPTETWTMDVTGIARTWVRIAESLPLPPPSLLTNPSIVYDGMRQRALLYSGETAPAHGQVWTISPGDVGPAWSVLAVDPSEPGPSYETLAAWDSTGDRLILPSGGWALRFDVSPPRWESLGVTGLNRVFNGTVVGVDAKRHRLLAFGGPDRSLQSMLNSDVFQLDLDSPAWSLLPTEGEASTGRASPVAAFDPILDRWLIASSEFEYISPLNSLVAADNQVFALWMDSSTPVRFAFADAAESADGLRLRWSGEDGAPELVVWRRAEGGEASVAGFARRVSPDLYEFVDRARAPGVRYGYRLRRSDGAYTDETWIEPGTAEFAFAPVRPNPAAGAWTIAWTQPRAGAVELSVTSVAGRRVLRRAWADLAAGSHSESVNASLPPGLYFLELRQGACAVVRRAIRVGR